MEDLKSAPKLSNEKHRSVEDTMLNVLRPLEENTKDLSIAVKANQRLIKSKRITSVKNPPLLEASWMLKFCEGTLSVRQKPQGDFKDRIQNMGLGVVPVFFFVFF